MKFVLCLVAIFSVAIAQDTTTKRLDEVVVNAGGVCKKDSDCGEGFCCVTKMIRRRFIFPDSFFSGHDSGTCQAERKENDPCHVFMVHDIFNPNLEEGYCPCMAGLECRGETVEETGGTIIHHNPKCQPKHVSP